MPTYELAILYKTLPKEGGIIRKLNNLGQQATPYRMSVEGHTVKQANYFVYEFDCPSSSVQKLLMEFKKYDSMARSTIFSPVKPIDFSACKLEEETQIAPFRKDVQDMLKRSKKAQEERDKGKVKPNHGLGFDPFSL
ncbi:probable 28S ribosomal protein S6, mitochondrial isoform X2 [Frankliniella occidentalis]|uniref:Small ribosomal subunit protein bS6m n=1 Tax=Frankliniella occidentalis TaxID=133901 RepID=A0A9C6XBV6_FRAOC|nr:probable 28S ribosomal protein S6, mitochondrial isoform X2 [Frankliniella occidentalis]